MSLVHDTLISHKRLPEEHQLIIKAADKISAFLKCQAELKAGNTEFEMAAKQLEIDIQSMAQPDVQFFMAACMACL